MTHFHVLPFFKGKQIFVISILSPQAWRQYRLPVFSPSTFATTLASTLLLRSVTVKPYEILWQNLVQILSIIRQCGQNKYKYQASSDNIQRLSTITPSTVFIELCPFVNCNISSTLLFESVTQKPWEILSLKLAQI